MKNVNCIFNYKDQKSFRKSSNNNYMDKLTKNVNYIYFNSIKLITIKIYHKLTYS